MCTGSFPGVKRPECGADHPPPSMCRGHERVELYLYSPSGPSWPVIGKNCSFLFIREVNISKHNKLKSTDYWVPILYSSVYFQNISLSLPSSTAHSPTTEISTPTILPVAPKWSNSNWFCSYITVLIDTTKCVIWLRWGIRQDWPRVFQL
jgi:hypothetical protein